MRSASARNDLLSIYQAALDAVNGRRCVSQYLADNAVTGDIFVIAIGKAAISMTEGAMDVLGDRVIDAFVVTKKGYASALPWTVYEGGHPLPDTGSLEAGTILKAFVEQLPLDARVLVLLSGGASAIVELPAAGIELEHLVELNQCLMKSGFDIASCNRLRQRVSRLKAGGLSALLSPRATWVLAISDVAGDDASIIGSGPLTSSTEQNDIAFPPGLSDELTSIIRTLDTDKIVERETGSEHVYYTVIANLELACRAAEKKAAELGYQVYYDRRERLGGVCAEANLFSQQVLALHPGTVVVCGGEPVINLPESAGRGGRCQHFALAAAVTIAGQDNIYILSAATDGSDGPGEDAGALIDGQTVPLIQNEGLSVSECLDLADSGTALDAAGSLISTGPTGSNVRDIFIGMRAKQQTN